MEEKKRMENNESPVPYLRRTRTAAILLSSLCWGLGISIPGLSLLELQRQVGASLQEITLSLTARSIGHLVGSFASGFCYDRIENHFVLASALFAAGTVGGFIPWVQDYNFLLMTMAIWGLFTGYIDTGNNFMTLGLWGKKAGPVLQAGNMLVAAGGLVVSLVVGPFLTITPDSPKGNFSDVMTSTVYNQSDEDLATLNITDYNRLAIQEDYYSNQIEKATSLIWIPYSIMSGIFILVSCMYFGLYARLSDRIMINTDEKDPAMKQHFTETNETLHFRILLLGILFTYLFVYAGNEAIFLGFLYTFAMTSDVEFSPQIASLLTTAFWGGFVLSRGVAILISRILHPRTMLIIDLSGCTLAALLLSLWGNSSGVVLFCGAILMGISMGSAWPAAVTWAERNVRINGKVTGLFLVALSLAHLLFPWIMGIIIAMYTIRSLMYFLLFLCIASFLTFTILQIVASKCRNIGNCENKSEKIYKIVAREMIDIRKEIYDV